MENRWETLLYTEIQTDSWGLTRVSFWLSAGDGCQVVAVTEVRWTVPRLASTARTSPTGRPPSSALGRTSSRSGEWQPNNIQRETPGVNIRQKMRLITFVSQSSNNFNIQVTKTSKLRDSLTYEGLLISNVSYFSLAKEIYIIFVYFPWTLFTISCYFSPQSALRFTHFRQLSDRFVSPSRCKCACC